MALFSVVDLEKWLFRFFNPTLIIFIWKSFHLLFYSDSFGYKKKENKIWRPPPLSSLARVHTHLQPLTPTHYPHLQVHVLVIFYSWISICLLDISVKVMVPFSVVTEPTLPNYIASNSSHNILNLNFFWQKPSITIHLRMHELCMVISIIHWTCVVWWKSEIMWYVYFIHFNRSWVFACVPGDVLILINFLNSDDLPERQRISSRKNKLYCQSYQQLMMGKYQSYNHHVHAVQLP